jgi:hypothetical protein
VNSAEENIAFEHVELLLGIMQVVDVDRTYSKIPPAAPDLIS